SGTPDPLIPGIGSCPPHSRAPGARLRLSGGLAQHPAAVSGPLACPPHPKNTKPERVPMCDQDSMDDMLRYQLKEGMSRRDFGALTVGAGLVAMLPAVANAAETTESEVEIKTPDGTCDAYFVHPAKGTAPGVLVWPDIFGLRPAFRQMGKRLAESGYS